MHRSTSCARQQLSGPLLVLLVLLGTVASGLGLASPASAADLALGSNATLGSGQVIRVTSGHELTMQSDGNLVLYQNSSAGSHVPVWASNTPGRPGAYLVMQGDGNAVVYQPTATSRVAIWASNTGGRTGAYLVLQDDGNLVMYQPTSSGRTPIWATNTGISTGQATGSARANAQAILANGRISLSTVHESGVADSATARQNIVDTANGGLAARSNYQGAPGGRVALAGKPLAVLIDLASSRTLRVSEIAGGGHSSGSYHYKGLGFDISRINGVSPNSATAASVVARCRALGARYAAFENGNHVHCDWAVGTA